MRCAYITGTNVYQIVKMTRPNKRLTIQLDCERKRRDKISEESRVKLTRIQYLLIAFALFVLRERFFGSSFSVLNRMYCPLSTGWLTWVRLGVLFAVVSILLFLYLFFSWLGTSIYSGWALNPSCATAREPPKCVRCVCVCITAWSEAKQKMCCCCRRRRWYGLLLSGKLYSASAEPWLP